MRHVVLLAASLICLASCSSPETAPAATSVSASAQATSAAPETTGLTLVDSGFGQQGIYVQGIAIVTTDSEDAVGEFVTVSMNFLDAKDEIVGTQEQIESFSWAGQNWSCPSGSI